MWSLSLTLVTLFASSALAQTSLFIPGFDPQPISADILGVDSQGRTTWALHAGAPTNTEDDPGFVGTATLVEGPNDASFTFAAPFGEFTIGMSCSLSGDVAVCSTGTGTGAATATETISRILVQAGTTAAAAAQTPDPTPNPSASSPSKSSDAVPSETTKDDSAPKPTNSSSAQSLRPYITALSMTIAMVAVLI